MSYRVALGVGLVLLSAMRRGRRETGRKAGPIGTAQVRSCGRWPDRAADRRPDVQLRGLRFPSEKEAESAPNAAKLALEALCSGRDIP